LPGIEVRSWGIWATTDAKGRYRLTGLGKDEEYRVRAGGSPYFIVTRPVKDTPGLEPITVDFELEQGLVLRGRMTDQDGKPVRGLVRYKALPDNPNLEDFTTLDDDGGETGPDGSFALLTIPGPGLLLVDAYEADRYCRPGLDEP